ncbi:hypothetical protein GCM10009765_36860 [Fodinicola feengrottensis]|uniref:Thioredoxin domain-containing protein n=2 Tax=Fodinicola feengrottensis TaxID=435914 RepID=A0ABN2H9G6_9ACTN
MAVLVASVLLVGVLGAVNLVLMVGVIRRLREHTEQLANSRSSQPVVAVGTEIGTFSASTVDGEVLSPARLDGETVVAFFSPECKPCRAKMPSFVEYAKAMPGGRERVLATIVGEPEAAAEFVAALRPVARVVVESMESSLVSAFQTQSFPTLLTVAPDEAGRLVVRANDVPLGQPALVG